MELLKLLCSEEAKAKFIQMSEEAVDLRNGALKCITNLSITCTSKKEKSKEASERKEERLHRERSKGGGKQEKK